MKKISPVLFKVTFSERLAILLWQLVKLSFKEKKTNRIINFGFHKFPVISITNASFLGHWITNLNFFSHYVVNLVNLRRPH